MEIGYFKRAQGLEYHFNPRQTTRAFQTMLLVLHTFTHAESYLSEYLLKNNDVRAGTITCANVF
jgi:hypothetical protein